MSIKNIKVRFNLDKENDRRAYEYFKNCNTSYSKAVICVINDYVQMKEEREAEEAFLERIIATVRENLQVSVPVGTFLQMMQPAAQPKQDPTEESETAALDFLDGFS